MTIYKQAAQQGISVRVRRRPDRDRYRKLSDRDVREIAARNQAGEPLRVIAPEYGVSAVAVSSRIMALGLAVNPAPGGRHRPKKMSDDDVRAIARRNTAGESIAALAREYTVNPTTICKRIARLALPPATSTSAPPLSTERTHQIRRRYQGNADQTLTYRGLGAEFGVSRTTIGHVLAGRNRW